MSVSDSTFTAVATQNATVLERVLLAIINAHTDAESEGRQRERLDAAVTALVGPKTPKEHDLEKALLFMVRERQKDICDIEMRAFHPEAHASDPTARSVPELAKAAAKGILGRTTVAELVPTAHLLCAMFQDRLGIHAREHDEVREALEAEAVQRLCDELAEWGVSTRI